MDFTFHSMNVSDQSPGHNLNTSKSTYLSPYLLENDGSTGKFPDKQNTTQSRITDDGPPKLSLFDLEVEEMLSPLRSRTSPLDKVDHTDSKMENIFYGSPKYPDNGLWVTVFGFPQTSLQAVLGYFSECGDVVESTVPPCGGNWVHIKYSSPLAVSSALKRNAVKMKQNMMVGVLPHRVKTDGNESDFIVSPMSNKSMRFCSPVQPTQPLRKLNSSSVFSAPVAQSSTSSLVNQSYYSSPPPHTLLNTSYNPTLSNTPFNSPANWPDDSHAHIGGNIRKVKDAVWYFFGL